MSINPLTTDEVRNLVALNVMTGQLDPEQVERFEAWVRSTIAGGLRDAADDWQVGGWVSDLPRGNDRPTLILGMSQRATNWLRARADRIEKGDR